MTPDDDADASDSTGEPTRPELPAYVLDPLERQSPERLETVAEYARALAAHRRETNSRDGTDDDGTAVGACDAVGAGGRGTNSDSVHDETPGSDSHGSDASGSDALESGSRSGSGTRVSSTELESLAERGVSTDPGDYESVPEDGAYVTIKETKPGYRYYYWQWREGYTWKNRYIGPVQGGK